jgi:hypothetical protein
MEEITKEWPTKFMVIVEDTKISNHDIIRSQFFIQAEYVAPCSSRKKKKEDVQEIKNALVKTASDLPRDEAETSKKRKVSPMKPSSRKKSKANKPKIQTVLTMDDIDLIIDAISDTTKYILQENEEKQETMYDCIDTELKRV